jgi:16S rRNA (cytidine1402-2'-O)-methyltransferase
MGGRRWGDGHPHSEIPIRAGPRYKPGMDPGLYVVGTPIGNLADVTLRSLEVLGAVHVVLAEDTRHTRKLMTRHALCAPLLSCHRFSEATRLQSVLNRIRDGEAVALVTDSGMPGVSDPGARIVAGCREAGLPVTVIPGPSAVTAAIALSGYPGEAFVFEGFLPVKPGGRSRRLEAVEAESRAVVIFESPHRLLKLLDELGRRMPSRRVFVGRELTKLFEEGTEGTPEEVRRHYESRSVKGELVLVLAPLDRKRHRGN